MSGGIGLNSISQKMFCLVATTENMAAFEKFAQEIRPLIFQYVFFQTNDHFMAEEVAQDTIINIFYNISSFRGNEQNFAAWIRRITRNNLIDSIRYHKKYYNLAWDDYQLDNISTNANDLNNVDEKILITKALKNLSKVYLETIYMRYFRSMSYQEIARQTGVPVNTVKTRLNYAKKRLKQLYYQEFLP